MTFSAPKLVLIHDFSGPKIRKMNLRTFKELW